jgi:ABC-2 type transport system permease protein
MNKVLLIIQREYVTRVRKKSFVIMTLLVPALFAGMFGVIAYVANDKDQTMHVVNVVDNSGNFKGKFRDEKFLKYKYSDKSVAADKKE